MKWLRGAVVPCGRGRGVRSSAYITAGDAAPVQQQPPTLLQMRLLKVNSSLERTEEVLCRHEYV